MKTSEGENISNTHPNPVTETEEKQYGFCRERLRPFPIKFFNSAILGIIILFVITFLSYIPALRSGFVWDDDSLTKNVLLTTGGGLWKIWTSPSSMAEYDAHYWPLVYSMFWVEYHLWGLNPFCYHLVNVLLHSLNAVLLWFILRRLSVPGAYLAAGIFALHPVHIESVAWVIERKDVLSGMFYLLSFLTYTHFNKRDRRDSSITFIYVISLFLFMCAMLSKSMTVGLPLAILLCLWWKQGRVEKRELIFLIPFFVVAFIFSVLDVLIYKYQEPMKTDVFIVGRFLLAGRAIWFYIEKLFLPINLMTIYPKWAINPHSIVQYIFPLSLVILLLVLWLMRRKLGRGPVVSLLFFIITLGPVLGFVNYRFMASSYVADRFQYLASIGLIVLFSALITIIVTMICQSRMAILVCVSVVLFSVLGVLTYKQSGLYKDSETLFSYTLSKNPNAWVAHAFLGNIRNGQGRLDEAINYYTEALRINPQQAKIHNNLGVAFYKKGDIDDAIYHFTQSLLIKPEYANAHYHLGICLEQRGNLDEAAKHFAEAIRIEPSHTSARQALRDVLIKQGKLR